MLTYCGIGATLAILTSFWPVGFSYAVRIPYAAAQGIEFGAAFAVCFGIAGGWRSATADIQPVKNVTWYWHMGLIGFAVGIGAWIMALLLVFSIERDAKPPVLDVVIFGLYMSYQ